MTLRIFRVLVRGRFAEMSTSTRDRLIAEAGSHDVFAAAFTPKGTFTYEPSLHALTFRCEVREKGDDAEAVASDRACEMAVEYLDAHGIAYGDLSVTASDMAAVWRSRDDRNERGGPASAATPHDGTVAG